MNVAVGVGVGVLGGGVIFMTNGRYTFHAPAAKRRLIVSVEGWPSELLPTEIIASCRLTVERKAAPELVGVNARISVEVAVSRKPRKGGKAPDNVKPARNPKIINDIRILLRFITISNRYQLNPTGGSCQINDNSANKTFGA